MSRCKRCGCKTNNVYNSKYSMFCKECKYIINLEKKRLRYLRMKELGTTSFSEHKCRSFEREQKEIDKEFKRLGLTRYKLYKKVR